MNPTINRYYDCSWKANILHMASKAFLFARGKPWRVRNLTGYAVTAALAVICFTFGSSGGAEAAKRVALLLAAEKYAHLKSSAIAAEKIEQLGQSLKAKGFDVTVLANPNNAGARAALREFAGKASAADFALIVASGHLATYRRKSFYLPVNSRVRRATDLFSRGLSVTSIADIARRAKLGALVMLVTAPDIPSTVAGVGTRPDVGDQSPPNLVTVFSTSSKVPVTSVDRVSAQAATDLIDAAKDSSLTLATLVDSASAGGAGQIIGATPELDLTKDKQEDKAPAKTTEEKNKEAETAAAAAAAAAASAKREAEKLAEARKEAERKAQAKTESERRARELAERRLRLAEERARQAERRARLAEEKAKQEQTTRRENAIKLIEEKDKPKTPPAQPPANLQSLQVVEALLGRAQRRNIQRRLQTMGLYTGKLDAVFGNRTRDAIKAFQRRLGDAETGYLTPDQLQKIVANR